MSETNTNKPDNKVSYIIFGKDKELTINEAKEQPLDTNIEFSRAESFEIIKDEKTGKILRVKDNRTLSEIQKDKYDRILKEAKRREAKGQDR